MADAADGYFHIDHLQPLRAAAMRERVGVPVTQLRRRDRFPYVWDAREIRTQLIPAPAPRPLLQYPPGAVCGHLQPATASPYTRAHRRYPSYPPSAD
jgi:hypothetical protein